MKPEREKYMPTARNKKKSRCAKAHAPVRDRMMRGSAGVRCINSSKWVEDSEHPDGGEHVSVPDVHIELAARGDGTKVRLTVDTDDEEAAELFKEGETYLVEISRILPEPPKPSA
jgi:hypothetical protein